MVGQTPISRAIRNYQAQRERLNRPVSRNETYNPPRGSNPNPIFSNIPPFKEGFTRKTCTITVVVVIVVIILIVAIVFMKHRGSKCVEPEAAASTLVPASSAHRVSYEDEIMDRPTEVRAITGGQQPNDLVPGNPDDEYITGGSGNGFMI